MDSERVIEKIKKIPLPDGSFAIVDESDYEFLSKFKWNKSANGSVQTTVSMARMIMGCKWIDHKDRNKLNCRRENLRESTPANNLANRPKYKGNPNSPYASKYKGVSYQKDGRKKPWQACIGMNGTFTSLGYFKEEIEAAKAYDKAAYAKYKEFAVLNFPEDV